MSDAVGTGDIAQGEGTALTSTKRVKPDTEFNGKPCFNIDCQDEYNSFSKGVKTFHRWNKHTKSENIRQWSKQNRGKSFYVSHNGSYTKVKR